MLMPAIWAWSTNLYQSDAFGAYVVNAGLKLIYLVQIENLGPNIQDNNYSPSTTRNPSLTKIHDVARNPNPKRIQDVIRNPNPPRIEDPMTYNGSPITWARAKKMKEALHRLIQVIWA